MRHLSRAVIPVLACLSLAGILSAAPPTASLGLGGTMLLRTAYNTGLPTFFGAKNECYQVVRFGPLVPGARYEVTLTYDAGDDRGYGHSWVDGSPYGTDYASFVGIGTGTGSRVIKDKREAFLFTVDRASTARYVYWVVRTAKPWDFRLALSAPTGVTRDTKDAWGYYYVNDFDVNRYAPFLLKR